MQLTTSPRIIFTEQGPARPNDNRIAFSVLLLTLVVCLVPAMLIRSPQAWICPALTIGAMIFLEPRLGLYLAIAVTGIDLVDFDPITAPFAPVFNGLPGILLSPVELLVLWTGMSWLAQAFFQEETLVWPEAPQLVIASAFILSLLLALQLGFSRGVDTRIAIYEMRTLLLILPVALITVGLVKNRRDLARLILVLVVTLLLMTLEGFWRYLFYVRSGSYEGAVEFAFAHESSVLVALLMLASLSWIIWGPNRKHRLLAVLLAVTAAIVLMTMRRRAGLIGGETGLIIVALFLLFKNWRTFLLVTPFAILIIGAYSAAFWNNPNTLGQPIRAFRTVVYPSSIDQRDQASDLYRIAETTNIWFNIRATPLEGSGFGVRYAKPVPLIDVSAFWPLWDYVPHNTILWVWMKAGIVAFVLFWLQIGMILSRSVRVAKDTADPWLIAISATTAAFVTMLVMFSYVDVGLATPRLIILLGIAFGLVTILPRLALEDTDSLHADHSTARSQLL